MKPLRNVWDNVAVGESGRFRLAVICSQDEPSRWAILIDTPLLHLWLDMPDHTTAHQVLVFFDRTRGKKLPVRVDVAVGAFCGRWVRLTKNDEDERYFLDLIGPVAGGYVTTDEGYFFLRLEEDAVADVVSALRQVVEGLDGRNRGA